MAQTSTDRLAMHLPWIQTDYCIRMANMGFEGNTEQPVSSLRVLIPRVGK